MSGNRSRADKQTGGWQSQLEKNDAMGVESPNTKPRESAT